MAIAARSVLESALVLVFGAVPATVACTLPLVTLSFFNSGLFLIWALCALFGTISLWVVVFRRPGPAAMIGLTVGIAAMTLYLVLLGATDIALWIPAPDDWADDRLFRVAVAAYFSWAPLAAGVTVLAREAFAARALTKRER